MRIAADNMSNAASQAVRLDAVGRCGAAEYRFERKGPRTILARSSCSSPWHYFPPSHLDDSGCAYTWLVNPSGGLVGGDHVTVAAELRDDTHVVMTSPSANRVYRSVSEPAVQDIRLSVGPGARLEWLPELTIPFAGSRFQQSIHVGLAPGATLVLWDAMASGRIARGERWVFAEYANEIQIHCDSGGAVVERFQLTPETVGTVAVQWDYVASLFVVGGGISADGAKRLHERLGEVCDRQPGALLGGVSEPAAPGLAVKVVANSAHALARFQEAAWTAVRHCLWDLPAPALRRY
ncbi:urease accessory protein UreD [Nitrospira moscoviensis]|uniref:Putative urease accessory protein UreD n=1 Tax=Nitrospira moscoviensis TaxID=42253 RepID=A0A0K2G9P5_NITMO|nr:urease accessory protein UreD [Nitrospira moscoviensis]ALA57691.1 putative urease accessory protein UreD [Nitrospira moscoviensis]